MPFCHSCGAALAETGAFCSACGTPVESGVAHATLDSLRSASIAADGRLRFRLGLAVAALGVLLLGIVVVFANRSSPPDRGPASASANDGGALTDAVRRNLFQHSRSCQLTRWWIVDFAGNGSPYRVERRHCNAQQLSAFNLPKSRLLQGERLEMGYDFLLVLKPPSNKFVHGEIEEGEYSSVEPITLQNREYVAVNGQMWGTSGDHEWCLLAQKTNGQFSCWHEQKGDLGNYLRKSLQPDERAKVGWSIASKDGRVFMESYVETTEDGNCCPSRGKIQVDLIPKDGVLHWSKVTRLASDNDRDIESSVHETPSRVETPEAVTPNTLYNFPKIYEHRRIQLVGWEHAMVGTAKSAGAEGPPFPSDCKYVLIFGGGAACASIIPRHLLSPLGAANEEDIDLICVVESVNSVGSLLTHCELSPSNYRRMKDREYQLETGKSPSSTDPLLSQYADAQLPSDANKYRPIEINTAGCSRLDDTSDTVMCVSSATVRDKGADGAPAAVSLTCFSGKWETCKRLAYQTYGFEVIDNKTHSQQCEAPSWLVHGMLQGKRTGCIKIHAQPSDLIYIIADGDGLCGHGKPQTCW